LLRRPPFREPARRATDRPPSWAFDDLREVIGLAVHKESGSSLRRHIVLNVATTCLFPVQFRDPFNIRDDEPD
jgi:hypothetical protein